MRQADFFVLDLADVAIKDDMASMEHPLFSLATRADHRHLRYESEAVKLEIVPSGRGLPTIFDKDVLIFCISQLMDAKNRGEAISNRVRFNAYDMMKTTGRKTGGVEYKRLGEAFLRLTGTVFKTDIATGDKRETRFFSLLESGSGFVYKDDEKQRLDYCEVILSDWVMRSIEANEVVTISPDYFGLRRPLERRLYEIARKHCGNQKRWQIGLDKLKLKTGSNAPAKRFRHNLRKIIEADKLPFYSCELDDKDKVTFRPRVAKVALDTVIKLPEWALEKGRAIAVEKGWDFHAVKEDYKSYAAQKRAIGEPAENEGAAFVGYCKSKKSLRRG